MFNFFSSKKEPEKLCVSTDIHCHVIPGIDDGSRDVETSIELVERMQSWGINRIIATPHVTQDTFENTPASMGDALSLLRAELDKKGNSIDISHSAEYRIDELFVSQLEQGLVVAMPNNYLLVENSFIQEPWNLDRILFDLKVKGYKPILAHPERYHYYHRHFDRYKEIRAAGTFLQINLLSLSGYYGKDEKNIAMKLIENNLVDFLGTDMHNHRHADAIEEFLASKDYKRIRGRLALKNDTL